MLLTLGVNARPDLVQYFRGVDTNWDGHNNGGLVSRGGQFPLSKNALSGWVLLNKLHLLVKRCTKWAIFSQIYSIPR